MAKITTITNPLTGQPAQVDQLDHTAQQIDDGIARALPGGYYDKWVSQLPGQNLLDNWYFGNPVDQRGGYVVPPGVTVYESDFTTPAGTTDKYYTLVPPNSVSDGNYFFGFNGKTAFVKPENAVRGYTGAGYGIDRWIIERFSNGIILIKNDGITLTALSDGSYIVYTQIIDNSNDILGKIVTISLLTLDGRLFAKTYNVPGTYGFDLDPIYAGAYKINLYGIGYGNKLGVRVYSNTANETFGIKAIKLELGSQQTLAHQDENGNWQLNALPRYEETLARCQRQFIPELRGICVPSGIGDFCAVYAKFPVTMRTAPVFDTGDVQIAAYGSPTIHKSLNGWETTPDCINYINFTGAGNYVGKGIGVIFKNISAEL